MKYTSTRGGVRDVDFSDIVFSGYAPDGGLYVPQSIPIVDQQTLQSWSKLNYARLTSKVLELFVNDKCKPYLDDICDKAFSNFESSKYPVPVRRVGDIYVAETFRGPTLAFKDIGLNVLSQIMELLLKLENRKKKANVLVETSGDTGPAAVASVMLNTTRVNVFCMFPYKQVTKIQARQLTTLMYKNKNNNHSNRIINIYATDRNSDDQCLIIKNIFKDKEFVDKYNICAMNSINFVRIAAQICYYFYCYLKICPQADKLCDFSIPSGAFGNTCAGSFAKSMGLPIRYLIPCCNENNIVFRTLMFGDFSSYFKDYHKTKSPAMDVQIAYNIERFFWLSFNMNGSIIKNIMTKFERNAQSMQFSYQFDDIQRRQFKKFIDISYCVSDDNIKNITTYFADNYNYLLCPHSACAAFGAYNFKNDKSIQHKDNEKDVALIAVATAHPAKFPNIIKGFFNGNINEKRHRLLNEELQHRFLPKPNDKEESIKLISDQSPNTNDNWQMRWLQTLKNDIIKGNINRSKL